MTASAIVAEVWCGACSKGKRLATVEDTPEGLVFESASTGFVGADQGVVQQLMDGMKERLGTTVPFLFRGVVRVMVDGPQDESNDWPPRVVCPEHGEARIAADDITAAVAGRIRGRRGRLLVHHTR